MFLNDEDYWSVSNDGDCRSVSDGLKTGRQLQAKTSNSKWAGKKDWIEKYMYTYVFIYTVVLKVEFYPFCSDYYIYSPLQLIRRSWEVFIFFTSVDEFFFSIIPILQRKGIVVYLNQIFSSRYLKVVELDLQEVYVFITTALFLNSWYEK